MVDITDRVAHRDGLILKKLDEDLEMSWNHLP